jgi:hypothetical protein
VDNVDDVTAADVNDLNDGVVALQTVIGSEGPPGVSEGRLTLATGTPVTIVDQAAKTTVYFAPYKGNRISLYDGSGWTCHHFTEKSVSVPATTVTPFDVFAYLSGGAVTLQAVSWTNDTTRATALTTQDGIYVKTGATTHKYLGTGRTTSVNGQTEDSIANRFLWNYYNRVDTYLTVTDSNAHTYNTATYRPWNNDATIRVGLIQGVREVPITISVIGETIAHAAGVAFVGVGLNTTSAASGISTMNTYTETMRLSSVTMLTPIMGYSYLQILEYASGAVNSTFNLAAMYVGSRK